MKISVIIPVYKNKDLFLNNLRNNLIFLKGCEVIVVNDDPRVDLRRDLQLLNDRDKVVINLILLENKKNLGFGGSVNRGVKESSGDLLFLLNSDVRLVDDSFKKAISQFENDEKLFAVSFLQIEKDGRRVGKNITYFRRGLFFHKKAEDLKRGLNGWAEGGSSIIIKKYFNQLNGFDERYSPFYWEDIDLSYRAYKRGWKVLFDPEIKVEHHHESTIKKYFPSSFIKTIAFRNQFIFIWKNIRDWRMLISHFIFLPYNFVYYLFKGKKEFFIGFLKATKYLWVRKQ